MTDEERIAAYTAWVAARDATKAAEGTEAAAAAHMRPFASTSGMIPSETIYFAEEVKGHKLLVTSQAIIFQGKRFQTAAIDGVTTSVYRRSVNAIPQSATYDVSVTCQRETITIKCAGPFWFGKSQYERLRSAIGEAVGGRLIRDALGRLLAGDALVFEHKGSLFERDSHFTLFREGIDIEQEGAITRKSIMIEWRHLRLQTRNGTCFLRCYSTGKKAAFQMWHMSNNVVFSGVLHFLLDKANYRLLETPARCG